ncbi:MAG: citronellol/citronellal dehydrogenase [Gammaproteobacteria bacterium]|jgi:citronellol/citronellal dehydrogenase
MHIPTTNAELSNQPTVYRDGLLDGQVVMISGGGSGMGRATAWLAARLGAQVLVCGRKEPKLLDVVTAIRSVGLKADHAVLDIRSRDSVAEAFSSVYERYGKLDSLINSAGGQFPQPAIEYTDKGWDAVINTNLNGTWHMMQAAARHWTERTVPGSITNIVVVQQGLHGVAHTRAARAGVIALSEAVSVEWASQGIRVNCIAPGAVQTEGWAVYSQAAREKYPRTNPTMRAGSPWEIAEACVYLSGPTGAWITGEVLTIDGGGQHWGEVWTTGKPEYFAAATRLWDDESVK